MIKNISFVAFDYENLNYSSVQLLYIDDQAPFSSTATVEEINYYTCLIPDLIGEHKNGFHNHILEYHSILSEETFYFLLNLISMR